MLFAIHALDRAGALPTRLANYDAHKAFLSDTSRFGIKIVMSGPLVSDDGERMIGSLFLIEAPGRAEVEAMLMRRLGLAAPEISTQVVQPEYTADYVYALTSCWGVMANLADDGRSQGDPELIGRWVVRKPGAGTLSDPIGEVGAPLDEVAFDIWRQSAAHH